jgi:hypothetical protein
MSSKAPIYVSQKKFCFTRYFRIIEFFIEKGARLDRQIPSDYITQPLPSYNTVNSYQVIHRIASSAWAGAIHFDVIDVIAVTDLGSSQIWHKILQSNTSDPCICACALDGCRPISLALKTSAEPDHPGISKYFGTFNIDWEVILNQQHWEVAVKLLFNLTLLLSNLEGEQLAYDVIRLLTFSALGLTHTCCLHDVVFDPATRYTAGLPNQNMVNLMDPTDIEELRDEEAELIKTLDCMVESFMRDFRELGLPLSKFLLEKWQETILVELSKKDEISNLEKEQLEELGVKIYVDPSLGRKVRSDEEESDKEESDEEEIYKRIVTESQEEESIEGVMRAVLMGVALEEVSNLYS